MTLTYALPVVEARARRFCREGSEALAAGAHPMTVANMLRDAYADMVMMETAVAVAAVAQADKEWLAETAPAAGPARLRVVEGRQLGQVRRIRPGDQCDASCTVDCGHCKGSGAAFRKARREITSADRRFTPLPVGHPARGGRR